MNKKSYEDIKLPIGTVCKLKGLDTLVMITLALPVDNDKIYDYGGCFYPMGEIEMNKKQAFNTEDIEKIIYMGYESNEEVEFKNDLIDLVDWDTLDDGLKEMKKSEKTNANLQQLNTDLFNTNK